MSGKVGEIELNELLRLVDEVPRQRSLVEAPAEKTQRIARLEIAWALERIGAVDRARELSATALAELDAGDEIERCVAQLYRKPGSDPVFEGKFGYELTQLWKLVRGSLVLAPHESADPFEASMARLKGRKAPLERVKRCAARVESVAEIEAQSARCRRPTGQRNTSPCTAWFSLQPRWAFPPFSARWAP